MKKGSNPPPDREKPPPPPSPPPVGDLYPAAARDLYRALGLMPCACCFEWAGATRLKRTKVCPRCAALERWRAVVEERP